MLGTTSTIDRLKKRGYIPMTDVFNAISPSYRSSLFSCADFVSCDLRNRRIRDPYVRWCERFSDRLLAYRQPTRLWPSCSFFLNFSILFCSVSLRHFSPIRTVKSDLSRHKSVDLNIFLSTFYLRLYFCC